MCHTRSRDAPTQAPVAGEPLRDRRQGQVPRHQRRPMAISRGVHRDRLPPDRPPPLTGWAALGQGSPVPLHQPRRASTELEQRSSMPWSWDRCGQRRLGAAGAQGLRRPRSRIDVACRGSAPAAPGDDPLGAPTPGNCPCGRQPNLGRVRQVGKAILNNGIQRPPGGVIT